MIMKIFLFINEELDLFKFSLVFFFQYKVCLLIIILFLCKFRYTYYNLMDGKFLNCTDRQNT